MSEAASSTTTPQAKGPDEKLCKSCGAAIKKVAAICPKCGVPVKKSGAAKAAFWLNLIFGILGIVGGGCAYNASRFSEAVGGETVAGVTTVGGILFWAAIFALVGGAKIKNSKPIGWKLSAIASVACVIGAFIGPNMQPLMWGVVYGLSAMLGLKDIKNQ